jgi:hypothetical protein
MKNLKPLLLIMAICEVIAGGWLCMFAATAIFEIFGANNSKTLYWLVMPIGALGLLLLLSGALTLRKKIIAATMFLGLAFAVSLIRWIANIRYVFPFGEATTFVSKPAPLTMAIWREQQFAFAMIIFVVLVLTIGFVKEYRATK